MTTTTTITCLPSHFTCHTQPVYLRKGAEVQVLYDDIWWEGKILLVHKGWSKGYKIKYNDEQGCEECHVPAERIRERVPL